MKAYAGKILMLLENSFPADKRVRNEASVLTKAGYKVAVIALRQKDARTSKGLDGVLVYRVPQITLFRKSIGNKSMFRILLYRIRSALGYAFEYLYFTIACLIVSLYIAIKHGFDIVHIHNPPNTLFIIGAFYRLLGKQFVFDHHDLEPELFLSRYNIDDSIVYKLLVLVEKLCLKLANMVIVTNESYREIDVRRAKLQSEKVFVVRNGPEISEFMKAPPYEQLIRLGKSILVYVGVMGPQDGVDYLLRALRCLIFDVGRKDFQCIIIGRGDALKDLKVLSKDLRIEDCVRFTGFITESDLLRYLSTADICLDPNPSSPLNDFSTWIKVMEYMALGKPVVSFDLRETRITARDAAIYVTPNNEKEFAKAIAELMDNPAARVRMGKFGQERVRDVLAWKHVSKNLIAGYDWLGREGNKKKSNAIR